MKKLGIIACLIVLSLFCSTKVLGYRHFEKYEVIGNGTLLKDFTTKDYDAYYKHVEKRRFSGWNTYYVNEDVKVKFVSETLFSYYNNGFTPITYTFQSTTKVVEKWSLSVTGSLSIKTQKNTKIFGDGLNASIKIDTSWKIDHEYQEKIDLKIIIDPQTILNLYMVGEGLVYNGVAAKYFLWFQTKKGGFETFVVTTHYQRLEILQI